MLVIFSYEIIEKLKKLGQIFFNDEILKNRL
jgi:hypothetical protein